MLHHLTCYLPVNLGIVLRTVEPCIFAAAASTLAVPSPITVTPSLAALLANIPVTPPHIHEPIFSLANQIRPPQKEPSPHLRIILVGLADPV
jgi:hypothetical protein